MSRYHTSELTDIHSNATRCLLPKTC
jgi:hypothetical protein